MEFTKDVDEHVVFPKKTDEERKKEEIDALGEIAEENSISPNARLTNKKVEPQAVAYQPIETEDSMERRETSTRDTVIKIQDWKKEQYRKQFIKDKQKEDEA